MRFRRQVRWALTRGIGAILAGVVLAFVTVLLEAYGYRLAGPLGILTMILISGGAMLGLVGGVMRPLQRGVFRRGMPAGRMRDVIRTRPVLRWWYGIDASGQARDE